MESEEYMNRKSRKQRGEAEVSILIITMPDQVINVKMDVDIASYRYQTIVCCEA